MKRLKNVSTGTIVFALLALVPISSSAQDVVFGGPAPGLDSNSGSWAWSGPFIVAFRDSLEDPANFGPGGTVQLTIGTTNIDPNALGALDGIDVFVSSWWSTSQSAPYETTVVDWFLGGGRLLLLQDSTGRDGIGDELGIPTFAQSNGSPSSGDEPLFEGPFGSGDGAIQTGDTGQLDPADIAANGGTVGGTNELGQVTAAYWCAGDYAPGAGEMVILADVDMISTWVDPNRYNPPNANGKLALNSAAFLAARCDNDGDGVLNEDDYCPDTVIGEGVPTDGLGTNRWALVDDDFEFDTTAPKGKGPGRSYSTTDTAGCSCEQIIELQGLGNGHTKFGCSISAMDDWVELVTP